MAPYTSLISLDDEMSSDVSLSGGKGASLGKIRRAGINVPPGFVITAQCFKHGMAEELEKEILAAFDSLSVTRVAVRSSAIAEDSDSASWAGQLDTYLNITRSELIDAVKKCWDSIDTEHAKKYAADHKVSEEEQAVAVVIQTMVDSDISGVLFTANPINSDQNEMVIEAVYGLGEMLVQGQVTPESFITNKKGKVLSHEASAQTKQLIYKDGKNQEVGVAPEERILDDKTLKKLVQIGQAVQEFYGNVPQDIEWAIQDGEIFIVQSRPITTISDSRRSNLLGNPTDLFYWGPSHAKSMYMSDFMAAVERFFAEAFNNPSLPNPPKTLVLFDEGKMVWLSDTEEFYSFTESIFEAYEKSSRIDSDINSWKSKVNELDNLKDSELAAALVECWYLTEFAEFALYGAEISLSKKLERFDSSVRHEIWSTFTAPDKPTFTTRIDNELAESKDVNAVAKKYPWILDGYNGLSEDSRKYFAERLKIVEGNPVKQQDNTSRREVLAKKLDLSSDDLDFLALVRKLAEFMDDRKAWMMQSRRLLTQSVGNIENGWLYDKGEVTLVGQEDTHELWQRYVGFKASTNAVVGIVASNGNKHFVNGEVVNVSNPTDIVEDNKIIVVPSTSPSFVPLMRKAKALITDHGGMMSHAAIVARELNLPCIVGTNQATKVLKDGDNVMLDLISGEVKR